MTDEEDVTAHLLRLAGTPPDPAAERSTRVRHAVHDAWRTQRRQQRVRQAAAIAGVCGLAVAATLVFVARTDRARPAPVSGTALATGARVQGQPIIVRGGQRLPLSAGVSIRPGDVVETNDVSRAALQTADGSSVKIDRGSHVRFASRTLVDLTSGATYVETADGSRGFEVRTPMGSVRDVGTQFEVRLMSASLRLRVRVGVVQIRRGATVTGAVAGTETTVTPTGVAVRQLPPYGPEWAWTTTLSPPFALEGHSLRAFLEHVAAEQGWTLHYANPTVAAVADRIVLHGSVEGLQPEEALQVALTTSGFTYHLHGGDLMVSTP